MPKPVDGSKSESKHKIAAGSGAAKIGPLRREFYLSSQHAIQSFSISMAYKCTRSEWLPPALVSNGHVRFGLEPVIRLVAPKPARSRFACRTAASPV